MERDRRSGVDRKGAVIAASLLILALILTACAPGVNPEIGSAPEGGDVAGFWLGLWHGIIAPVTFVISLFTDNVNLYEVHNNGNWYDFGFVLGAGILFGGGFGGTRRRS
ncbi:MAG: hypothetical protein ACLFWM_14090 [Actinomycetota bacterium]